MQQMAPARICDPSSFLAPELCQFKENVSALEWPISDFIVVVVLCISEI